MYAVLKMKACALVHKAWDIVRKWENNIKIDLK